MTAAGAFDLALLAAALAGAVVLLWLGRPGLAVGPALLAAASVLAGGARTGRLGLVGAAALSGALAGWHTRGGLKNRRRRAAQRLASAERSWWETARAAGSDAAAFACRLRAWAAAAYACADALGELANQGSLLSAWHGPPPLARELSPKTRRPGPEDLWRRFDACYRAVCGRLHPAEDCLWLAEAALALASWITQHQPVMPADDGGGDRPTYVGPGAAMVHALASPCMAERTARHTFGNHDEGMRVDARPLAEEVSEDGSPAQRTMVSLAYTLAGHPVDEPSVLELLDLADSDLCHALEAIALARKLDRVFPAQRPELLWLQAALSDSQSQASRARERHDDAGE